MGGKRHGRDGALTTTCAGVVAALVGARAFTGACSSDAGGGGGSGTSPEPSSSSSTIVASEASIGDRFGDGMIDEQSVQLVVDSLVVAGVGVSPVGGSGATEAGAGPIVVGEAQARALGAQADLGGGLAGREIRDTLAVPETTVPIDVLVAAWLVEGMTPAAQAAASLVPLAELEDPASFVFPWAVLLMFVNDVGRSSPSWSATAPPADGARAPGASECDNAAARLSASLDALVAAIGTGSVTLDRLVEVAVPAFGPYVAAAAVASAGAGGDRPALVAAATALGFAAGLAGIVEPWVVALVADPPANEVGILPRSGRPGRFEGVVVPASGAWSDEVSSCARDSAVSLPPLDPRGAEVTWALVDTGVADVDDGTTSVSDAADDGRPTAVLHYVTRAVSPDSAGDAPPATISATLRVHHHPGEPLLAVTERLTSDAMEGAPAAVLEMLGRATGDPLAGLVALTSARSASSPVPVATPREDG